MIIRAYLLAFALLLMHQGCRNSSLGSSTEARLSIKAATILNILEKKDFAALEIHIHPKKG